MTAPIETIDPVQTRPKVLLLDDDPDALDLYQQMLSQLPSQPEVHIAASGPRAMAMLEEEAFNVLVSDLKMPKMDGLQVITIVRRQHPQLRTIILTAVTDEQMRARAYSMGIDLYLEKPGNQKEMAFLSQCIESLLDKEKRGGFRGVQSKSLVDLIQLECLSGSSSVLKITNGKMEGKIWISNGELIDAATQEAEGEEACKRILLWKAGSFEILPGENAHPRRITTSYQGLLLDTAQAMDEAQAAGPMDAASLLAGEAAADGALSDTQFLRKARLGGIPGLEFALKIPRENSIAVQSWGVENPEPLVRWIRSKLAQFQTLGDQQQFGALQSLEARGAQRLLHVAQEGSATLAIGMLATLSRDQVQENVKKVLERWVS